MVIQLVYMLIAFCLSAILGKIFIPILKKLKVGQNVRLDGPRTHLRKQGTPTMGGIMIIITIIIITSIYCFLNWGSEFVKHVIAIMIVSIGFGIVGFIDDYKKVVLKNNDGLSPKLKMFGLGIISVIYSVYLIKVAKVGTGTVIPFINYELMLPIWIYIPFIIFVMLGSTNAVNLTDGIDGLAGSVSTIMIAALSIISYRLGYIHVSAYAAIIVGATFGFLIYNFYKAKVIMGDTGSLLLGGIISSITIYMKCPFILVIIAIIPIIETLSVIAQVIYFRKTGKRLFKMSPLHHHCEMCGWRENKVVAVFSLVTLIASVVGIFAI